MAIEPAGRLGPGQAALLTFLAAACVLVLEIAAGRLLAPYVGVSLLTYTGIIGVILAGIALGAWLGGKAADAYGPLTLLGPTFVVGGLTAMAAVPIVDVVGALDIGGGGIGTIVLLSTIGFVAPAAVLSAVAPMIVRATISDLTSSGSLVGRLSAIGTAGAITGTFATGFVLLGLFPTRSIIVGTGMLLVIVGVVVAWRARTGRRGRSSLGALGIALVLGGGALAVPGPCEQESAYYCIAVVEDPYRPDGRTLVLDRLRHAYVDLADPHHLEFAYIRWFDAAIDEPLAELDGAAAVLHVGGGGFSFPRHLQAAHPASRHTILELDPVVHDIARRSLAFSPAPTTQVVLGDARMSLRGQPTDAFDIVIGDAFGGLSVPWHLTTQEFVSELDRVLVPGGRYVMNLIDGPERRFVRAEAATLEAVFEHVVVADGPGSGNVVLVASDAPIDAERIRAHAGSLGAPVRLIVDPSEVAAFIGDAEVLTDDRAPVDQLIGR
jgi:predicted membrane-bound spermidine synthase